LQRLRFSLIIVVMFSAAVLLLTGCGGSKYAAKVNDSYITKDEFQETFNEVLKYYETTARKLKDTEKAFLKQETLDRLINEEIVSQAAALKGVSVPDKQVDEYINDLKQRVQDPKKYQELLEDRAYSEKDWRERLKVKFLTDALSEEVTKNVTDPIAKKETFDKYVADLRKDASIKIYEKF